MISVYILKSTVDNGYYIGICKDLSARLKRHNDGFVSSTKHRKPFVLIYKEEFTDYKTVRVREIELKSYKGGNKLKELIT